MRLDDRSCHLTYCTNIHPGERWEEVRHNLERYVLAVKHRLRPTEPFGVGLRLSAAAATELQAPATLEEFKSFLATHDLYVFTINGFPYGNFHDDRIKAKVYRPDWRDGERLRYTNTLADILTALLPSDASISGSISTLPGAFKPDVHTPADIERMATSMVDAVIHLVQLQAVTGKAVALAVEPEPCCVLETVSETIAFFHDHLFSASSVRRLAAHTGLARAEAEAAMRDHIGVCLDLCHAAVEYEDPIDCVTALRGAGVQIHKMQISAGLRFPPGTPECLRRFDDGIYLHQVVERAGSGLVRYTDLAPALASIGSWDKECERRIHFHVPIFLSDQDDFGTTQEFIRHVLDLHRHQVVSSHLEVETYTWGVMPAAYQSGDVVTNICRELEWVRKELQL